MKITKTTLDWYRQKTQPKWAKSVLEKETKISIDGVINSQSGYGKDIDNHYAVRNLLSLCKSYRKRKLDLVKELKRISNCPGTVICPEKRASFAKKWANRIQNR